jgi:glycosyltransferase involved in cell wall biosynthesis
MLRERYGVERTPTDIVPNGGAPVPLARPDDGLFRFAYAGALHATTHGVARLIEAFRRVADPHVRLVLMGPDGEWIADQLAENPDPRIDYVGCLDAEEVQSRLAPCDMGVLTGDPDGYHSTGCPGKLGSYLAAGLPVLSTVHGDCARIVARNANGVVCDWDAMAETMASVAADPERIARMRERAEALRHEYAWTSIYGRAVAHLPLRGRTERAAEAALPLSPADDT